MKRNATTLNDSHGQFYTIKAYEKLYTRIGGYSSFLESKTNQHMMFTKIGKVKNWFKNNGNS